VKNKSNNFTKEIATLKKSYNLIECDTKDERLKSIQKFILYQVNESIEDCIKMFEKKYGLPDGEIFINEQTGWLYVTNDKIRNIMGTRC
jgi:hypothetical protein